MGKFSSDKDFAKRVSMHRDPEQHKKRDDNKKRGDNPNARRNKYKEQNNALNSRKDEHEKWGYELLNRKEQIFNQNKTTEEKAKTAAAEENKAAANAASVLSDKEIGEELNRLTAAFRATNGEKEEGELRAFAALHHLNLRVGTAVSKTDKSVIARMVFNGGVEKPMGNYSPKFADIANYPYKDAGTPGKAEDYDLESSTVWQAMKEEPRLAEMQDKLKAALAKAGVPKEILPEMNINDFKYLMFNHCAAQKGLGFAKLFQARDENGNPLTYKDRSGKEVPVCTSAKQENVKRFIKENPQFKDMMLKMPGIDKAYVEALVNKMSQSGLTDMSKELERHPEWANQPAIDVHHIINIKDCRLFEAEGKSYADVNAYENMCIVSNGTLFDAVNRAHGLSDANDKAASVHGSIHSADMVFKDKDSNGDVRRTMVRLEPQPGVRCMLGFGEDMMIIENVKDGQSNDRRQEAEKDEKQPNDQRLIIQNIQNNSRSMSA